MSIPLNKINKKISDLKKKIRYSKYFNSIDPFTKSPVKKFVIYTRGRTGSTVLTDLLNSHPEMYCDYEIFNTFNDTTPVRYPLKYIDSCSKRATLNKKSVYGFKVKIEQLKNEQGYKDIGRLLKSAEDAGWKMIYLRRVNIFNHAVSGMIANQTKVFHLKNKNEALQQKIKIDVGLLLGIMNYFEELGKLEEDSLRSLSYITVSYEDDLLDNSKHQETSDKIFQYLGIKSFPVNTQLKKIIPENLADIISNYDEVYDFIKKSKHGKFLN